MANIKMDYMDILFKKVNDQLLNHLNSIVEMRGEGTSYLIYTKTYIRQTINEIYYNYSLADDIYSEARREGILKKRHHEAYKTMFDLKGDLDCVINESGYASSVFDAHTKANKS